MTKIGLTIWQKRMIDKIVAQYAEIGKKPMFEAKNSRIFPADRLGFKGREYSDSAQALTDLAKKLTRYITTVKYAQEKLGNDFIKLAVEEYG